MTTSPAITTPDRLDETARRSGEAAPAWRASGLAERAGWIRAVAAALDGSRDELVAIARAETSLAEDRLVGEVARTTGQLRLFAEVVEEGSFLELVVDDADPAAVPPRPELRRLLVGVGPVAVYSASNFPFAFSVCGGDTASAWAAGNPVVVKAHSGHPELSRRTAEIAQRALAGAGAPEHSLSLVEGREAGVALVRHPAVQAAAFTGSLAGGRALFDLAVARPDPIPFYGELGSLNPVVLTPAAVAARGSELARGLAASFTSGAGQFCTKPGVVLVPEGSGFEELLETAVREVAGGRILTVGIADAFDADIAVLAAEPGVEIVARGAAGDGARPIVMATDAATVAARGELLLEERFGPVTLLVRYRDSEELRRTIVSIPAGLTGTVHAEAGDDISAVVSLLSDRAGRILFAGWPTGVAVTWSQHHGGPWPASTSLFTSVGATAVRRFLRPVVYQDAPAHLLPQVLTEPGLASLPHRRNGMLRRP